MSVRSGDRNSVVLLPSNATLERASIPYDNHHEEKGHERDDGHLLPFPSPHNDNIRNNILQLNHHAAPHLCHQDDRLLVDPLPAGALLPSGFAHSDGVSEGGRTRGESGQRERKLSINNWR